MSEIQRPPYRTTHIEDIHYIDSRGFPVEHYIKRTILALELVNKFYYRVDTSEIEVEVLNGGTASDPYPHQDGGYAIDINLDSTLMPHDELTVAYNSILGYSERPDPVFRRYSGAKGLLSMDTTVIFDKRALPDKIWWATWQHHDSPVDKPMTQRLWTPETFEGDNSSVKVHNNMQNIEPAQTLGFYWQW